jgi:hypothetical protein
MLLCREMTRWATTRREQLQQIFDHGVGQMLP